MAVSMYLVLMLLILLGGKRSISEMGVFDYMITLALASILTKTVLDDAITLFDGLFTAVILISLQYCISRASVRYKAIARFFEPRATLVFYEGKFLNSALRHQRVTRMEIYEAMRKHSFASVERVQAVVLETNGSLSVIPRLEDEQQYKHSTCQDVEGWAQQVPAYVDS